MVPIALRPGRSRFPYVVTLLLVSALVPAGCHNEVDIEVPPRADHVVVGELLGRTGAFLTVSDAAARVAIVLAVLPDQLYRISTPAGSGLTPWASTRNGRVRTGLRRAPGEGPGRGLGEGPGRGLGERLDEVRIVLNRAVRWDIRLPAGAGEQQLDLTGGHISRIDLGAAGLVELRLPSPDGTLPITFTGSVGTVVLAGDRRAPVRVRLDGGAGAVDTAWAAGPAMAPGAAAAPGTVLITPGWAAARDRYSVRAWSGVTGLTMRGTGGFDLAPDRPAAR
jgi:hypothetical protein